jgi:hypothetical protein
LLKLVSDEGFSLSALAEIIQLDTAAARVLRLRFDRGTAFNRNA